MDFLNKLYESNYFGIGLFAVISFLVVTFLVVLFFGKKDEKKRKLEATNNINMNMNEENTFKETSVAAPLEMPVPPVESVTPIAPIATPITEESMPTLNVEPVSPVSPLNFESTPVAPVAPINYEEPTDFVENLNIEEPAPIETITPVMEPVVTPIAPVVEELTVEEPKTIEEPVRPIQPTIMEPIKIEIPEKPIIENSAIEMPTPIIEEEPKPIIEEEVTPIIIEEPTISETYYRPVETPVIEEPEIKVPNIDFDALASSISKELDELEKKSNGLEEVNVTPIREVTNSRPTNTFSSVYVTEPASPVNKEMDMPKKIDLPTMKNE